MKFTFTIKKNGTFKYVLNKGNFKSSKNISIHCDNNIKKNMRDKNFFGICISKKNGNSVQRNKMKRWIREIYKQEEHNLKKGYNIVVLYKKSTTIDKIDYFILENEVKNCLEELGLYEKN